MVNFIRDENHVPVAGGVSSTDSTATLPFTIDSATGRLLTNSASGAGDVVGPASATDNAVVRFDGATGKLIQNSTVIIADTTGVISGTEGITFSGTTSGTTSVVATAIAGTTILTLPAATDTLVGKDTTDILTNKTLVAPALGTPASGVMTNVTGTATSLNIGGNAATATSATSATSATTATNLAAGSGGTIPYQSAAGTTAMLANGTAGQILQANGTTLAPTWVAAPAAGLTIGTTAITSGTTTRILYDNAGTLGEYTITGTGTVVAMATSPSFTTPSLGVATATSINGNILTAGSSTYTGTAAQTYTFPTTTATIARTDAAQTFTGVQTFTAPILGTPTSATLTNATGLPAAAIVAGTLATGTYLLAENASIGLDPAGSADGKYTGITVTGTGGATIAFGEPVYLAEADSRWELTDASAEATAGYVQCGIAVSSSTDGTAITVLLNGIIRADAAFPAFTIGKQVFLSETAGDVTQTAPTTADAVIRSVGFAITADELYWNCSPDYAVHV